jgi:PAS domain S-box-containing protein
VSLSPTELLTLPLDFRVHFKETLLIFKITELGNSTKDTWWDEEAERITELYRYEILDTPPDPTFDRVTQRAASLFAAPISLITFVDLQRQFFKSHYGLNISETPREYAFCSHAIQTSKVMVVCDATEDVRFSESPLVLGPPKIRFYAGASIETVAGFRVGTLCVIDTKPRATPDEQQLAALSYLAKHVGDLLELHRAKRELATSRRISHETEQRAALALDAGRMGYWERDAETDLIRFSPMLEKLLEINHEEYDGSVEGWLKHIHPDDHQTIFDGIEVARKTAQNYTFKYRVLTADGSERWITTTGTYKQDEAGNFAGAHGVSWDSTIAEVSARELKLSEALFRGLSESAPVGVFRSDDVERLIYVNAKAADIFSMSEQQMLGQGWSERIHPEDRQMLQAFLASDKGKDKYWEYEVRLLLPDDAVRWILVRSTTLLDAKGDFAGKTGTVEDITQRRQTLQYLQEAKEAAERANRTKDLFLANVSHELRTPLNGVLGISGQLVDTPLNAEQLEMVKLVEESGSALLRVVNDMLDLNRIEAGQMSIERAPFRLRKSIQQTVKFLEADAQKKGLTLVTHYAGGLPDTFYGDVSRIKQILTNYLSNAIKFSDRGEIDLTVQGEVVKEAVELLVSVSDHGPGIELAAQSKLFRSFSQLDDSSTRRSGGLGLGLAICKRLAELMGGSVGVSSSPGRGSTFWVRLRLEYAEDLPAAMGPPVNANGNGNVGRVLLVEDNVVNQRVALGVIRKLGWQADVAGDGAAAVDLCQRNDYAVVFMDCQMPQMDGYVATEHIRKWEASNGKPAVPIVALTAHAMTGDRERCLDAGMNDYLAKPFGLEELRTTLERWAKVSS